MENEMKDKTEESKNSNNSEKKSEGRAHGLRIRFSFRHLRFYLFLVVFLVAAGGIFYIYRDLKSTKVERLHQTLYSQIQKVAELTVIKNRYCDVICIRTSPDVKIAKASAIVKYNGILRAGIPDVSKIDISVSPDGKSVEVHVPHSQILDNTLESQELFDEKTFLFVKRIPTQGIFDGIAEEMENKKVQMINEGILDEADLQLQSVVEGLLSACGFQEIVYRWASM